MKVMVFGDPEVENASGGSSVYEEESMKLTDELLGTTLLQNIIELAVCGTLPFETRKEASAVAAFILHHKAQSLEFLKCHEELVKFLVCHYASACGEGLPDVALECGALLREAIHHTPIATLIINDLEIMNSLFNLIQEKQFDLSSDAWQTFRLLLTEPKSVAATYLENHFDLFVEKYTQLLLSDNFVTKRQSLKLLSDLLLCRANFNFMIRFTASSSCLKHIMNLCRTKSLCVQLEAFNVLKLFVANPKKSDGVIEVLSRNKIPLCAFLKRIAEGVTEEEEKSGGSNRHDEAFILIANLEKLPPVEPYPPTSPDMPMSPKNNKTEVTV